MLSAIKPSTCEPTKILTLCFTAPLFPRCKHAFSFQERPQRAEDLRQPTPPTSPVQLILNLCRIDFFHSVILQTIIKWPRTKESKCPKHISCFSWSPLCGTSASQTCKASWVSFALDTQDQPVDKSQCWGECGKLLNQVLARRRAGPRWLRTFCLSWGSAQAFLGFD